MKRFHLPLHSTHKEKHRVTDSQGIACAHFHTLTNIPVFNQATTQTQAGSRCDAPADPGVAAGVAPAARR